jgi:hypothetical protein
LALANLYKPTVAETGFIYFAHTPISATNTDVFYTTKFFGDWRTSPGNASNSAQFNYVFATSVAAVPEADSSAMLLMGSALTGFIALRRKNTQA